MSEAREHFQKTAAAVMSLQLAPIAIGKDQQTEAFKELRTHEACQLSLRGITRKIIQPTPYSSEIGTTITIPSRTIQNDCHVASCFNWVLSHLPDRFNIYDTRLEMFFGISDGLYCHTWLYDPLDDTIIESTGAPRMIYFGYKEMNPLEIVLREYDNIEKAIYDGKFLAEDVNRYYLILPKLVVQQR